MRGNRRAPISRDLRNLAKRFVRSRESVRLNLGKHEIKDERRERSLCRMGTNACGGQPRPSHRNTEPVRPDVISEIENCKALDFLQIMRSEPQEWRTRAEDSVNTPHQRAGVRTLHRQLKNQLQNDVLAGKLLTGVIAVLESPFVLDSSCSRDCFLSSIRKFRSRA